MPNRSVSVFAVTAAAAIALTSCQQLFTTSLAGFLARDSYTVPADLSVADASSLLAEAKANGDADLAAALVAPLVTAMDNATTTAAYDEAASAALEAVILASEVGPVVTTAALAALDALESGGSVDMGSVLESVASVSLTDAEVAALVAIAADPPTDMPATDAITAALALVGDSLEASEMEAMLTTLGDEASVDTALASETDPSLLAAYQLVAYAFDSGASIESLLGAFSGG